MKWLFKQNLIIERVMTGNGSAFAPRQFIYPCASRGFSLKPASRGSLTGR